MVEICADNWITILGRVKRFAKIGGEMVSLTAAEQLAAAVWPDARHAVIAEPDNRKGERLVLVTDQRDATAAQLLAHAQAVGVSELAVPRKMCACQVPRSCVGAPARPTMSPSSAWSRAKRGPPEMLTGACHCGACHWTFDGDPGPATACNCTLCRRYGALWVYDYEGERISVLGATASNT